MRHKYRNPPIIEALCEFILPSDAPWDLTVPGLIYEKVKGEFPNKEHCVVTEHRVVTDIEEIRDSKSIRYSIRNEERILFFDDDKKTVIQVGQKMISVSRLKPYKSWAEFKPIIQKSLDSLIQSIKVDKFEKISLRYINKIEIPGTEIKLEDYLEFYPYYG